MDTPMPRLSLSRILTKWVGLALGLAAVLLPGGLAEASIVVLNRDSTALQTGNATGGNEGPTGFTDESLLTDPTGPFSFDSDELIESRSRGRFGIRTESRVDGNLAVNDQVVDDSPGVLMLSVSRDAAGSTLVRSGSATLTQAQRFQVDFVVADRPVSYTLAGLFDPNDLPGVHRVWLGLIGGPAELAYDNSAAITFAHEGELAPITAPGEAYRFVVELDQTIGGTDNLSSTIDLDLVLNIVPDPGTGLLLVCGLTLSSAGIGWRRQADI